MSPTLSKRREKHEQAACRRFLELALHATVYTLGTTRRTGDHQGTMQTPGLPDLLAFVFVPSAPHRLALAVECKVGRNRRTPAQDAFRLGWLDCALEHVTGGLNDLIAWALEKKLVTPENVPHYRLPTGGPR